MLGLSVPLTPQEEPVPPEQPPAAFLQPGLLEHHQPGPLLPPHLHPGQVKLPSLHLLDLCLLGAQPQLEGLALVRVA